MDQLITPREQQEILQYVRWKTGTQEKPDMDRVPRWLSDLDAGQRRMQWTSFGYGAAAGFGMSVIVLVATVIFYLTSGCH